MIQVAEILGNVSNHVNANANKFKSLVKRLEHESATKKKNIALCSQVTVLLDFMHVMDSMNEKG